MLYSRFTHRMLTAAGLAAALTFAAGPARADQNKLIERVSKSIDPLSRWGDRMSVERHFDEVIRGDEQIAECLAAVKAAVAGGVKMTQEIAFLDTREKLPGATRRGKMEYVTLAAIKAYCAGKRAKVQLVRTYIAINRADSVLSRLSGPDNIKQIAHATMLQRICAREVARALKMKNSPDIEFHRPDIKLGQAAAKICDPLGRVLAKSRDQLRQQADLAKFHAVLENDRRKVFDDNLLFVADVFGESKYPLATPDDFENLDDWYLVSPDQGNYGEYGWRITIFHFEGNKLVATDSSRHGLEESEPPKEAFAPYKPAAPAPPAGLE